MKHPLLLLLVLASPAAAQPQRSCTAEIGPARAATLVAQCQNISPATRPPCNATNPCSLIRDEIARGCRIARQPPASPVPAYCAAYP